MFRNCLVCVRLLKILLMPLIVCNTLIWTKKWKNTDIPSLTSWKNIATYKEC